MTKQRRSIQNFKRWQDFKDTPSDFTMYYLKGLRGAIDIDFIYGEKDNFLIIEGKAQKHRNYIEMPYAQAKQLYELADFLSRYSSQSRVWIVGYTITKHERKYNVIGAINFWKNSEDDSKIIIKKGEKSEMPTRKINISHCGAKNLSRNKYSLMVVNATKKFRNTKQIIKW